MVEWGRPVGVFETMHDPADPRREARPLIYSRLIGAAITFPHRTSAGRRGTGVAGGVDPAHVDDDARAQSSSVTGKSNGMRTVAVAPHGLSDDSPTIAHHLVSTLVVHIGLIVSEMKPASNP